MMVWQPSSNRPFVEVSKDKVAPRGTSAADVLVTDRDRCVASNETALWWRCAEIRPRAHEVGHHEDVPEHRAISPVVLGI